MTARNSISATELGDLGKCKALVKLRKGASSPKIDSNIYWGNRKHSEFENNVERYMRRGRKNK